MHQVHPDASLIEMMKRMAVGIFVYHLFTNNITPGVASVAGDFTEMTGGTGYADETVDDTDFTTSGVSGNIGTITAPDIVFSVSSGSTPIYGYYVTDATGTILLAAARFSDAPKTLDSSNPISVTPKMALKSRYAS